VQKLGKNQGGYHGETIDIRATLGRVEVGARRGGWGAEVYHAEADFRWLGLHRAVLGGGPRRRVYISAGIHGDEPAGPLAVLRLIEENQWPAGIELFLVPCLNPVGFTLNRRENAAGLDLNRDYRNSQAAESRAHIAWLERQPEFDLQLCLHEDWESQGFYLYEQNPESKPSLAEKLIEAVQKVCPIDLSGNIEGREAHGGIVRPNVSIMDRPDWPEAFYIITHKSRLGYTLEAPSDFPLATRVDALVAAVRAALELV
jgi:hypothetical protein